MSTRYELNLEKGRREEELVYYISCKLKDADSGEILLIGYGDVTIHFNTVSGDLRLSEIEEKPGITNIYSPRPFEFYLMLIKSAISFLAKNELLQHLHQINNSDISSIINEYYPNHKMPTISMLDHVFDKLINPSGGIYSFHIFKNKQYSETFKEIVSILSAENLKEISCKAQGRSIIKKIDNYLAGNAEQLSQSSTL